MNARRTKAAFYILFALLTLLLVSACDEAKPEVLTPDRDAAETLANALAINTGGVMDQIADLCEFLVPSGNRMPGNDNSRYVTMNKTYDEFTQEWTITYEKVRGVEDSIGYAHIYRVYILKYLNADEMPQKYYVTDGDTARAVRFRSLGATGSNITRRIRHQLDSLNVNWTVTNANQTYVSLTGTYYRAGQDTISGWNKLRVSDHSMTLDFNDFQVRRALYTHTYQYHNGSVSGNVSATVTFLEGTPYTDTVISRPVNILVGNGRGEIDLGDLDFTADLAAGELID